MCLCVCVHPPRVQVLLSVELVPALCRLISCSVADGNQKLQALHLLRAIIRDESTHAAIVGAQAINTIVQQVGSVVRNVVPGWNTVLVWGGVAGCLRAHCAAVDAGPQQ